MNEWAVSGMCGKNKGPQEILGFPNLYLKDDSKSYMISWDGPLEGHEPDVINHENSSAHL